MAGRGCSITINVLGGSCADNSVDEFHLPVALHSPLEVLKQQLADLVGISYRDQVLILLDLSDPERNHDLLLIGRDHESLRNCGIRNGSILTLHALGMSAELKQKMTRESLIKKTAKASLVNTEPVYSLPTVITAAQANHSFNGVIFDIMCKSPYEVDITSISLAGMLGRIRIFVRDRPWESDKPNRDSTHHWFAHNDGISQEGWSKLVDFTCRPSWDRPFEIPFEKLVRLLPNTIRAFYCHSSLPDDLGIQYQSYGRNDVIAEDEAISIHPGLGHTGSVPFDETHGWYRSFRGPAGSVQYRRRLKGWQLHEHANYPTVMKEAIRETLLCSGHLFIKRQASFNSNDSMSPSSSPRKRLASQDSYSNELITTSALAIYDASSMTANTTKSDEITSPGLKNDLGCLPVLVVYHIFEYMNWDWFADIYEDYEVVLQDTKARYLVWKESHSLRDPLNYTIKRSSSQGSSSSAREVLPARGFGTSMASRMATAFRGLARHGPSNIVSVLNNPFFTGYLTRQQHGFHNGDDEDDDDEVHWIADDDDDYVDGQEDSEDDDEEEGEYVDALQYENQVFEVLVVDDDNMHDMVDMIHELIEDADGNDDINVADMSSSVDSDSHDEVD